MKQEEAVYHRIHSCWILVQTWCTLRFSDHRGISPREVKVDASGLAAVLRRSKTIGTDKSVVSRPLVLDSSCFVKERIWLVTGWKVLQEAASFERDFMLPAPSVNLRCCRRAELKYDQGYALQNRVLRELKVAGLKMFQHPITNFWTPHSGPAYLPTATQVLAFPKEERDFLGGGQLAERSSTCNARLQERSGQEVPVVLRKKTRHCPSTTFCKRKGSQNQKGTST